MDTRAQRGGQRTLLILEGSLQSSSTVDTTISVVVARDLIVTDVGAGGRASLGGSKFGLGGLQHDIPDVINREVGVGRDEEGRETSGSRAGHGGAGKGSVGGGSRVVSRADLLSGGRDVGLLKGMVGGADTRAAGGEGREGVIAIGGSDSDHDSKISGGVGGGAGGARVSLREERDRASLDPGLNVGKVGGRAPSSSPRVGDKVGSHGAVGVRASLAGGADDPFGRGNEVGGGAGGGGASLGGDPFHSRGHSHPRLF